MQPYLPFNNSSRSLDKESSRAKLRCFCGTIEWKTFMDPPENYNNNLHICTGALLDNLSSGQIHHPPRLPGERHYVGVILPKKRVEFQNLNPGFSIPFQKVVTENSKLPQDASIADFATYCKPPARNQNNPDTESKCQEDERSAFVVPEYLGMPGETFVESSRAGFLLFKKDWCLDGEFNPAPGGDINFKSDMPNNLSDSLLMTQMVKTLSQVYCQSGSQDWTPFGGKDFLLDVFANETQKPDKETQTQNLPLPISGDFLLRENKSVGTEELAIDYTPCEEIRNQQFNNSDDVSPMQVNCFSQSLEESLLSSSSKLNSVNSNFVSYLFGQNLPVPSYESYELFPPLANSNDDNKSNVTPINADQTQPRIPSLMDLKILKPSLPLLSEPVIIKRKGRKLPTIADAFKVAPRIKRKPSRGNQARFNEVEPNWLETLPSCDEIIPISEDPGRQDVLITKTSNEIQIDQPISPLCIVTHHQTACNEVIEFQDTIKKQSTPKVLRISSQEKTLISEIPRRKRRKPHLQSLVNARSSIRISDVANDVDSSFLKEWKSSRTTMPYTDEYGNIEFKQVETVTKL